MNWRRTIKALLCGMGGIRAIGHRNQNLGTGGRYGRIGKCLATWTRSDAGLGDFLLKTIDDVTASAAAPHVSACGHEGCVLPLCCGGRPVVRAYPVTAAKGKVLVNNFWATCAGRATRWNQL